MKRAAKNQRAAKQRKARIAARNGKLGGRPRSRLPQAVLEKLGPPPDSPLQLARWATRLLAETGWLQLKGEIGAEIATNVRALVASLNRSQPADIAAELERLLAEEAKGQATDEAGPQLVKKGSGVVVAH